MNTQKRVTPECRVTPELCSVHPLGTAQGLAYCSCQWSEEDLGVSILACSIKTAFKYCATYTNKVDK